MREPGPKRQRDNETTVLGAVREPRPKRQRDNETTVLEAVREPGPKRQRDNETTVLGAVREPGPKRQRGDETTVLEAVREPGPKRQRDNETTVLEAVKEPGPKRQRDNETTRLSHCLSCLRGFFRFVWGGCSSSMSCVGYRPRFETWVRIRHFEDLSILQRAGRSSSNFWGSKVLAKSFQTAIRGPFAGL